MIKDELAKQLKDAGFPQTWPQPDFLSMNDALEVDGIYNKYPQAFDPHRPTLEELIEACGEVFDCLRLIENGWAAFSNKTDFPHGNRIEVAGWSNPTEAVARLWLALNEK